MPAGGPCDPAPMSSNREPRRLARAVLARPVRRCVLAALCVGLRGSPGLLWEPLALGSRPDAGGRCDPAALCSGRERRLLARTVLARPVRLCVPATLLVGARGTPGVLWEPPALGSRPDAGGRCDPAELRSGRERRRLARTVLACPVRLCLLATPLVGARVTPLWGNNTRISAAMA